MKKSAVLRTLAILAVFILGASALAWAQLDDEMEINVPFTFMAGQTQLPPGQYILNWNNPDERVIELRSADGRTGVFVEFEPVQTENVPARSKLIFDKIGNQNFLATIWPEGAVTGMQLVATDARLRAEKKNGMARSSVAVEATHSRRRASNHHS